MNPPPCFHSATPSLASTPRFCISRTLWTFQPSDYSVRSSGTFAPTKSEYIIEQNRISNVRGGGILLAGGVNVATVRNNIINGAEGSGINLSGDRAASPAAPNVDIRVYNNTSYGNTDLGVIVGSTDICTLRNNLVFGNNSNGVQMSQFDSTGISSNYNVLAPLGSTFTEGANTVVLGSTSGIVVNAAGGDFHLLAASPAVNIGINLASKGFAVDFDGVSRPQGVAWDIGAYEFLGTMAAPTHLTIFIVQ